MRLWLCLLGGLPGQPVQVRVRAAQAALGEMKQGIKLKGMELRRTMWVPGIVLSSIAYTVSLFCVVYVFIG